MSTRAARNQLLTTAQLDAVVARSCLTQADFDRIKGRDSGAPALRAKRDAGGARSAPLDLIEEHLTDDTNRTGWRRATQAGRLVKNWAFPDGWTPPGLGELTPVLKIQPFSVGGYEASIRMLDIDRIGKAIEFGGCRGKREKPDEIDLSNVAKAGARAKSKVRLLVKNMGATHLATLTRRESNPETFWTPEQWAKAWDSLRRLLTKLIGDFPYVAVLEQHKKGNYHLHVAWVGRIPLNQMRPLWWAVCGGRGMGNVDAKYIKVLQGHDRSHRIAAYISKYVAKHFEDHPRFNKKRYWASRQSLEEARRYVMRARTFSDAFEEMREMLGINLADWMESSSGRLRTPHLFLFPGGNGCWLSFLPELHGKTPPPF